MKKKKTLIIIIVTLIVIAITGIVVYLNFWEKSTNKNDLPGQKVSEQKKKELEKKLLEFGHEQFETEYWTKGGITPATYYLTIAQLKTYYDIKDFEGCNEDLTMIQFIVSVETEEGKTNYEFKTVLDCE